MERLVDVGSIVLGLALLAWVLWDASITVLHPDTDGALASGVRRRVWWIATRLGERFPSRRTRLVALAGPCLLLATFVVWVSLLILGIGLLVWPSIDCYSAPADLGELGFVDALYYAGSTVTVLGFGDITPLSTAGKLIAVVAGAVGFALFTGMATYVIQVVNGLAVRNQFTLAVHDDLQGDGGASMLARCLIEEGLDETRRRCRTWSEYLRAVDETVQRYPMVALTYRSRRAEYQPEIALRHAAEAAVGGLLISTFESGRQLRASAEALALALHRLQHTVAETYLPARVGRRLADPRPTEEDHKAVARLTASLAGHLGGAADTPRTRRHAAETVYRSRVFLTGLGHWTGTDMEIHEWED